MSDGRSAKLFNVEVEQNPLDSKWNVILKCPGDVRLVRGGFETREEASVAEMEGLFIACEILAMLSDVAPEPPAQNSGMAA